jgi:U3 small nucleolar RNA-associated protein 15
MKSAIAGGAYEYFADMEQVFNTGHIKSKTAPTTLKGPEDEFRAETKRRLRLKEFDRFLRTFKYSQALDAALKKVSNLHGCARDKS